MSARSYLRIDSWHVLRTVDNEGWKTYCGRTIVGQQARGSDALPLGEKSCETCLRLVVVAEAEAQRRATVAERDAEGSDQASGEVIG